MAHHTLKTSWSALTERLNRFPQGAPPSELLNQILKVLFSEREAYLVSLLPIKPFTAQKASRIWKTDLTATRNLLETLAGRALLVDIEQNGEQLYTLPPPMAGFFEFSLMRVRVDIDQQALSELFYEYLNVEEDFIRELFTRGETQLGRVFVNEAAITPGNALQVLDYERATEVIKTARHIGVGICYCRHKMEHMGRTCDAPKEICMTFNSTAASLTKYGHVRRIDAVECLDLLDQAYAYNLVQFGENVRNEVSFICNCCGICVRNCTVKGILLKSRAKRVLTPISGVHKVVMMAVERGKLQHLIFDNRVLFSHRALAAVLGVLLKLPPIQQVMASNQIKSRFFERVISRLNI